jgi:aspartyl-tRNA(Asn)/glutamyl-tRNA(Gln) amidotransferase subunit B
MEYQTTIGLEIHAQLKTKSKMFCSCDNNAEGAMPNSLACPVCLGMPGVLPVANRQAIEWTILTGLALNSEIANKSKFDRKHYFYPDLPKNYQISQYDLPFCIGGYLEIINQNNENKKIGLTRIHLEEDAGKLIHADSSSLVDLNRAGTPLMEIVTEPEISSPEEAKIFLQELRTILRYLSVSEANMEKGHLRCDANISIRKIRNPKSEIRNEKELGIPVEIKNINSFRMLERALIYEEKRQREVLEQGGTIVKETRGWNDAKGETYSQRSKEIASDYRYFPEPDLPMFTLKKMFNLDTLRAQLPELPAKKRERYIHTWNLKPQDAAIIAQDAEMAKYFEKVAEKVTPALGANWVINELKTEGTLKIAPEKLIELLTALEKGEISGKIAKEVSREMAQSGKSAQEIINSKGLKQVGDEKELNEIIDKIIYENPKAVADLRTGKNEVMGFLVGQIMRETKGQANPEIVNRLLKEKL